MNAEANLTQNYGVYRYRTLVVPQPLNGIGIGDRLGGLAENISIDQVGHSVSVDSDSIGTK